MTDKKLSNLECIRLAWSWGWSAVITFSHHNHFFNERVILFVNDYTNSFYVNIRNKKEKYDSHMAQMAYDEVEDYVITGYLYAGQLAGSDPIPERQKFRVKIGRRKGEIAVTHALNDGEVITLTNEKIGIESFFKSEIEPYFE